MPEGTDPNAGGDPAATPVTEFVFDPTNPPPDVQRFLDQERTRASETARRNALKDAVNDPTVIQTIRTKIEQEANLSADERVRQQEAALEARQKELDLTASAISAKSVLVGAGIDATTADALSVILADPDTAVTTDNVTKFISSFEAAVDARVEVIKNELLANGGAPQGGPQGEVGAEATLRAEYAEAMKQGDTALAVHIQRKARSQGIVIE